jgi:hypothetical protein
MAEEMNSFMREYEPRDITTNDLGADAGKRAFPLATDEIVPAATA